MEERKIGSRKERKRKGTEGIKWRNFIRQRMKGGKIGRNNKMQKEKVEWKEKRKEAGKTERGKLKSKNEKCKGK